MPAVPVITFAPADDVSRGGSAGPIFAPDLLAALGDWLQNHEDAVAGRMVAVPGYDAPTTKGTAGSNGYKLALAVTSAMGWPMGTTPNGDDRSLHVRSYVRPVDKAGAIVPLVVDGEPNKAVKGYALRIGRKGDWNGNAPSVADSDS